ncbi:MAG: hypothetical protein E7645_07505 [Ruminococcaceae bacterium]|nr:hypothetical protein [Oscillospiraceae bacterium]
MAIKMRVLYESGKKGMAQIATAIKEKYELPVNAVDNQIPPAYSCDRERIVIIAISAKNDVSDAIRRFCGEFKKERAANVAVLVDGNQAVVDKLSEVISSAGTNLVGTKLISLGGFGPFGGAASEELKAEILAWIEELVANCK